MSRAKLKRAPLKEVVFETFWELTQASNPINQNIQLLTDPGYSLAIGAFATKAKEPGFVLTKRAVPDGVKIPFQPEFQFWTAEGRWPVLQCGPGIVSVNDTDVNYSWDGNYVLNIRKALSILKASYDQPIKLNRVRLQYINHFPLNGRLANDFIEKEMGVKVSMERAVPGTPHSIGIQKSFLQEDGSVFSIDILNGIHNAFGPEGVVWTLTVDLNQALNEEQIFSWLDRSHKLTSDTFHTMLNSELYASFDR